MRVLALALALLWPLYASAAEEIYPNRPVQIVVPFPPGGGTDVIARVLGQQLGLQLGQSFVTVNRPGASTIVGTESVVRAKPDGYTLLLTSISLAANPSLFKEIPFDAQKDLAPISLITNAPTILVANKALPATTVPQLVAYLKSRPGEVAYASYGSGSGAHLGAALFENVAGVTMLHVPYNGGGPAVTAVLNGEAQLLFASILPVLSNIRADNLRPLALAAARRFDLLPDVPTFAEVGIPYRTGTWFGLLAPAHTPPAIIARLNRESVAALALPEVRDRLLEQGAEIVGNSPAEFAAFIREETERWARVLKP
jgi:tripartite-type tricarboxylate transporter receptor subunit TctC